MGSTVRLRVGQGFDIHRLEAGRELRLAGVALPFERGLRGHSDGDAVLHAVCDALLGALGAGDIGSHFPDSDPRYAGADSAVLVRRALDLVRGAAYSIVNVDVNVLAEQPRLAPHIDRMRTRLAEILEIDADRVSIKAKTMEGLGAVGRGDAIASTAVVLLHGTD